MDNRFQKGACALPTFRELGIPFPLFEASASDADQYVGEAECTLCEQRGHCFRLGLGDCFVLGCPSCKQATAVRPDQIATPCGSCDAEVPLPGENRQCRVCYACLRAGKAALTKDTEFGAISWREAMEGKTDGRPERHPRVLVADPFGGMVKVTGGDEEGWRRHKLPRAEMFELMRTPTFTTWQGETWLFEDARAMTYIGTWRREDFVRMTGGKPAKNFFLSVVENATEDLWDHWRENVGVYLFRGPAGKLRATWDID